MKKLSKFILLVVVSGTLSINGAYGSEEPKYVIGSICESQYNSGKPKDIFCFTESKFLTESAFFNDSGREIPAGTPVSIVSQNNVDRWQRSSKQDIAEKLVRFIMGMDLSNHRYV